MPQFETKFGYWSEISNDGRYVCEDEQPDWWWNKESVPGAFYGWMARVVPADGDYWWAAGQTEEEAIANCLKILEETEEAV